MAYEVTIESVDEARVAAVRARVAQSQIAASFAASLDKVWAFLRSREGLRAPNGHNVFIYSEWSGEGAARSATIDFGVQVTGDFTGEGDVACRAIPAGRVATTVHRGPYNQLGQAHAAIQRWCGANGHAPAGVEWETYGDWDDDPAKLETQVSYLLG